ncbi:MAG: serine hydrolase [Bacteroidales bacterium]|nr:serine hydrolase [Bacteroidales bacterium]
MMKPLKSLIAALLVTALPASAVTPKILTKVDEKACRHWVDSVYNSLSLHDRIAQLFVPMVNPNGDKAKNELKLLVETTHVGGLLFNRSSLARMADMTAYAQSMATIPLMITFDGEWGLAMRIDEAPRFPYNMALGAIANERLLYDYGREVARECQAIGVHVNFAPDLDVNTNPANPVIGYRSFGESPQRVGALGSAYSQGLESGGVLSVSKHFPGHGDTSTDSHKELPTVTHSLKQMESDDIAPFKRYVGEGLGGVMVGHLNVPALDPSGTPASLSKTITTDYLKNKMGFEGLVFTDALAMKGAHTPGRNNCVVALQAGADILLSSEAPISDIKAVEQAVKDGRISNSLIEQRCKKVLTFKYALGLNKPQSINTANLEKIINSPQADAINRRLAAACITCIRNDNDLLPIPDTRDVAVVNIGNKSSDNAFTQYCGKYAQATVYNNQGAQFSAEKVKKILAHEYVVIGVYDDSAVSRETLAQFTKAKNVIPVFFMSALKMGKFANQVNNSPTLVLAGDDTPYLREYAAQAVFGGINVTGRLPVNLKGIAPLGSGVKIQKKRLGYTSPEVEGVAPWLTDSIDALVAQGIKNKAFPGCQVLIAKGDNVIFNKNYGTLDFKSSTPVTDATIYDLASVSKATGTLPGIMKAFDSGLIKLDEKASKYIPGLRGTDKENITVRQLLYHESGMPASLNMYQMMMDTATYTGPLITGKPTKTNTVKIANRSYGNASAKRRTDIASTTRSEQFPIEIAKGFWVGPATYDSIMARIYNAKLRPNNSYNYSCLNFALLADAEQHVTGESHDKYVGRYIFEPLEMYRTVYRPLDHFPVTDIAPTEHDPYLRKQTVRGYVHDELAAMSGGVQGNAGLFSTANDLARLCRMYLQGGQYAGNRVLSEATVKNFTTSRSESGRRGLGFDITSPTAFETKLYGHTGFTGTCFWIDPETDLIYIFLSNRVNPTRDNAAFSRLNPRTRILDYIYKAMGKE